MKRAIGLFTAMILLLSLYACTAAQTGPGAEVSQAPTWQEQYDLGIRYLSEGNCQESIIAFTAAIEIDPKQAPAYVGRGDAYVLSGETEDNLTAAKADYETAIELDETSAEAYLGLADVFIRQGDYEKAQVILKQGLEITGDGKLQEQLNTIQHRQETQGELVYSDEDFALLHDVTEAGLQLTVKTNGSQTASITLSGLSLRDNYVVDLSGSDKSILEYGWKVTMYGVQIPFGVGTTSWCWSPGQNETKALADMQHNMWGPSDNPEFANTYVEGNCSMYYTSNSIKWIFTVPAEYDFNFKKVNHYEVEITDVTKDVENRNLNVDFYI